MNSKQLTKLQNDHTNGLIYLKCKQSEWHNQMAQVHWMDTK